jgi:chromate transporter
LSAAAPNPPTALGLFVTALKIGTLSFGGALSGWVYREFVTKNGWVSEAHFLADMTKARMLPGTNAANITALLGYRLLGLKGSSAGLAGFLLGPFCLLLAIYHVYDRFQGPALDALMEGAAAGAIGPVVYLMIKSIRYGGRHWYGLVVIVGTAAAILLKISLLLTVCVAVCISILLVRFFGRPHAAKRQ